MITKSAIEKAAAEQSKTIDTMDKLTPHLSTDQLAQIAELVDQKLRRHVKKWVKY